MTVARMIFSQILKSTLFVLFALVSLFAFFDLISQSRSLGTSSGIWEVFLITGLTLPNRIYEILPIAAMLASIFTLSRLAATSQFTVLRVSGVGPWRFFCMLMAPGLVLVLCAYLLGDFVAPPANRISKEFRLDLLGRAYTSKDMFSGIWVRDIQRNNDGTPAKISFVNVKSLKPGEAAYNWAIYSYNRPGELSGITTAQKGVYNDKQGWVLYGVTEEKIPTLAADQKTPTDEKTEIRSVPELVWGKSLDGNIFGLLMVSPEEMSLQELSHYIEYLKLNGQSYQRFEIAFWSKAFYPLAILVMLALSMTFAYQNVRSGGMAVRIFIGAIIGIFYYALNNLFAFMGDMDALPPVLSALIPTLFMTALAAAAMWFAERRS